LRKEKTKEGDKKIFLASFSLPKKKYIFVMYNVEVAFASLAVAGKKRQENENESGPDFFLQTMRTV
jgi:hypothetical protein